MSNILKAFVNIVNNYQSSIATLSHGNNRANSMGEGVEQFIQNAFANSFEIDDENARLESYAKTFAYQGNQNNPPDLILHNSDAIEIKKLRSKSSAIALNSSYPKAKLEANSPMITQKCKECKEWSIKDMLYAIGYIPSKSDTLKSLWFVYGDCYCADSEIYERMLENIEDGLVSVAALETSHEDTICKIKRVDSLGITELSLKSEWYIANPYQTFNYLDDFQSENEFEMIALMSREKYNTMILEDKEIVESMESVAIKNVKIKNPNNPVKLIDGVVLKFKV